jgi:hypothetical protein
MDVEQVVVDLAIRSALTVEHATTTADILGGA